MKQVPGRESSRRWRSLGLVLGLSLAAFVTSQAHAQRDDSLEMAFCDDADPANRCDDPATCKCTNDNLFLSFDGAADHRDNVFLGQDGMVPQGLRVTSVAWTTTESMLIQGWSIAVKHDPDDLDLQEADITIDGTDAGDATGTPFIQNKIVATDQGDGTTLHGYISAVVLDLVTLDKFLPVKTNSIVKAVYTTQRDLTADGTLIQFANNELGVPNSPPVEINFTNDGLSRSPRTLRDSRVGGGGGVVDGCDPPEPANALYFGDTPGGDALNVGDGDSFVVGSRNEEILGFQFGVQSTGANPTTWAFTADLGTNESVAPTFTAPDGTSISPELRNTATSNVGTVSAVARGAALQPFQDPDGDGTDDDFLGVDLGPFEGGLSGFTVGYAADIDAVPNNMIPATPDDQCVTNELLIVTLGEAPEANFIRGEAEGNDRINISDAIIVLSVAIGRFTEADLVNLVGFFCPDAYDADDDGVIMVNDGMMILQHLFDGGGPLPAPFDACGADPTDDNLGRCQASFACP